MSKLHTALSPARKLYFNGTEKCDSRVLFGFENYGKTPAIIRQVRADLFLTDNDELPKADFNLLPVQFHEEIVPGETRQADLASKPAVDLVREFDLSADDLRLINAEATGKFKRFFLVGQVIYDDFYGNRFTRRFCRKLRYFPPNAFQAQHGGVGYNGVTRSRIPKHDPLEKPENLPLGAA